MKTKVLLIQLGSPASPSESDVRAYLREFLSDPRVVDAPRFMWLCILYLFVLPFRPKKSARAYRYIWDGSSFPLVSITLSLVDKIKALLPAHIEVEPCFILSRPRLKAIADQWNKQDSACRAQHWIVIPQFPQYSESTTASVFDVLSSTMHSQVVIPSITFLSSFNRLKSFIDLTAKQIQTYLQNDLSIDHLLVSFHGIPTRRVLVKKDIYEQQCLETFALLKERINFPEEKIHLCFQSRFGSEEWLMPATSTLALELAKKGAKKIAVSCPSFVVDCLETTVEIGIELKEELHEFGTDVVLIPALNDFDPWVKELSSFIVEMCESGVQAVEKFSYPISKK
jgi:ferrochelatase